MLKNNIKVGDYVKTKYGISKVEKDRRIYFGLMHPVIDILKEEVIIKSSPNIIDLIEYCDIVKYKIDDEEFISEVWGEKNNYFVQNFDVPIDLRDLNIVSIVTKEQFESMEYKIER